MFNKYGAVKTVVDDIKFDSKAESYRYLQLKCLCEAKEIFDLKLQEKFPYYSEKKKDKKLFTYIADFTYYDKELKFHVEDVKGMRTSVFNLKKKLIEDRYPFEIEII
jgi:hypothetical protein